MGGLSVAGELETTEMVSGRYADVGKQGIEILPLGVQHPFLRISRAAAILFYSILLYCIESVRDVRRVARGCRRV